jgi:hypothetical protein
MCAGQRVESVAPLELYEPECNQTQLQEAVDGLNSLNALYDTATSNDNFYQLLFYSNAYVARFVITSLITTESPRIYLNKGYVQ